MLVTWHYFKIIHIVQILKPVAMFVNTKKKKSGLTYLFLTKSPEKSVEFTDHFHF